MAEKEENLGDIAKDKDMEPRRNTNNTLQTISRVISILPCVPKRDPQPPTPNIDQIKQIYQRFNKEDPNQTDVSLLDRIDSHDLCRWSGIVEVFYSKNF